MSNFMLMEPTNQTFQELVGNGLKYKVPRFQRDYAWQQEQWEDLWDDLLGLDDEEYHYMGYIVLQQKGQHDFDVIDGQQRLITLSLIILAGMKQIQGLIDLENDIDANKKRLTIFYDRFIGSLNSVTLRVNSKLQLNRNNNTFYKAICSNLEPLNSLRITISNRKLSNAFTFFSQQSMGTSGEQIAAFIEKLSSGMMFTKIVVQNKINAYKVFETLNARGVQLSTPDLLKNSIFSEMTKYDDIVNEDLDNLDESWSSIVDELGGVNFSDFIRYHHNFQKKLQHKKALFSSIRGMLSSPQTAQVYLNSLIQYSPIYVSLLHPNDEWWSNQDVRYKEVKKYLEGLSLFNIKQPLTIFMSAFVKFTAEEFVKTVKYLYVLSIRYNVICHHSPSEQEKTYNQIAIKVFSGEYKRASHIKNGAEYKKLYPDDRIFANAFEFHKMPSRQSSKKIRFLLSEIETALGYQTDYLKTTLEHICPYHREQHWDEYFGEGVNNIQDRLGNVILLEKDELKRLSFTEKKDFYLTTPFVLAKKIAEYEDWNLQNLNDYQKWLSDMAVKTWGVS